MPLQKKIALAVASVLNHIVPRNPTMQDYDTCGRTAEVSDDNLSVEHSYRDGWHIPKEGAYESGHRDYEEKVEAATQRLRKTLERELAPYSRHVASFTIKHSEKSWLHVKVELVVP